jgi:hypothetical protein
LLQAEATGRCQGKFTAHFIFRPRKFYIGADSGCHIR